MCTGENSGFASGTSSDSMAALSHVWGMSAANSDRARNGRRNLIFLPPIIISRQNPLFGLRQQFDQSLFELLEIGAEKQKLHRNEVTLPLCDDADVIAKAADFVRVVTAQKDRVVFTFGQPMQELPHVSRLAGRSRPRVGSSRNRTFGSAHELLSRIFDAALHAGAVRAHDSAPETRIKTHIIQKRFSVTFRIG